MKFEIKKGEKYYEIILNNNKLDGLYNEKELIKAIIGIIRSSFNITDFKLKDDKYY